MLRDKSVINTEILILPIKKSFFFLDGVYLHQKQDMFPKMSHLMN